MNGTAALHIALQLASVQQGDEVLAQALTFIATANAISYTGARPVFIDVDKDTMGLSPASIANWLEEHIVLREYNLITNAEKPHISNCPPFCWGTSEAEGVCILTIKKLGTVLQHVCPCTPLGIRSG